MNHSMKRRYLAAVLLLGAVINTPAMALGFLDDMIYSNVPRQMMWKRARHRRSRSLRTTTGSDKAQGAALPHLELTIPVGRNPRSNATQ